MVTIRRNSLACQDQPGCLLFSINVRSTYLPHLFQKNWNADKNCRTGLQSLPTRVRIAYGILAVTWIATQLSLLLSCQPFHAFWQISPNPGSG
jgi:hypothetical protein